jgi:hypothetical protein
MPSLKSFVVHVLAFCLVLAPVAAHAEAVDDKFTQISPQGRAGGDEKIHGAGFGKILMRIMVFGAVPNQGIHYVPEGTDMFFLLLYCGGHSDNTKLDGITIRRRGAREIITVDLEDLMDENLPIPKLVDGDVVTVPFNWRKSYNDLLFYTGVIGTLSGLLVGVAALVTASKK